MLDETQCISVSQAAKRCGVHRVTMWSRLIKLDAQVEGRLLRRLNVENTRSKIMVVVAVLEEIFPRERSGGTTIERLEADLNDAHNRIDSLAIRADGQSAKLRAHDRKLKKQHLAIEGIHMAQKGLLVTVGALVDD